MHRALAMVFVLAACGNGAADGNTPDETRAPSLPGCQAQPCHPECARAVSCTRTCGGPSVNCGCCGCAEGFVVAEDCPAEPACASDADCGVILNSCDCSCFARHVNASNLTDAEWNAICAGQPMRNCGVASPCMNVAARCDSYTHRCEIAR